MVAGAVLFGWTALSAGSPCPPGRGVCLEGTRFALVQAASAGSVALYATEGMGPVMVMAGGVTTPATGYRAVVLGGGTRLRVGSASGVVALGGVAHATNGRSARLYLLPSVTAGRLNVAATATALLPLGGSSRREASLNPLAVTWSLGPAVAGGAAVAVKAVEGSPARTAAGPAIRLQTPAGALSAQFLPIGLPRPEVRGTFRASF